VRLRTRLARVLVLGACLAAPAYAEEEEERPEEETAKAEAPKKEAAAPKADAQPPWPALRVIGPDMETYVSTKTPGDVIGNPSSLSVLRQVEIRGSAARAASDVLRLVPGLEVQRVYSTLSNVSVRGFIDAPTTAQGILCLIDGRQTYNEFLGNPLWDQLMLIPEDIEEIEVIRGPGSFLYGPNAMHGLVNFRTKAPLDYAEGEVYSAHSGRTTPTSRGSGP
jgi:outer membrane receptor for ferrienterochelin and colicin